MNRSNSFVSALKWWPLQGHNNNNHSSSNNTAGATAANGGGSGGVPGGGGGGGVAGLTPTNWLQNKTITFGSSVAVQKLRESKWFKPEEQRIFCAVVECGFIVEVRNSIVVTSTAAAAAAAASSSTANTANRSSMSSNSFEESQDENETPMTSWFGVVLCKTTKDNKPKPDTIEIFSVKIRENGTFKLFKMPLEEIWTHGWELRINNFADKEKAPHNEKDIRNQVSFARKAKQSLWNNNKHFAYWCRYGSRQQDVRKRQMSECVKWGNVGMNAGMLLVMNKQKSYSTSK